MSQKVKKGMSIMMEHVCEDAKHGNMDLKESVCHMGNVMYCSAIRVWVLRVV